MLPHHGMPTKKPYAFKSMTERAIEKFVGIENPTLGDLNVLKVAGQVEAGVEELLAHAIVSGGHPRAVTLRGILAKYKIRIDDPDNGCWLPNNTEAKKKMRSPAVPHSRIHRKNYYRWMDTYIRFPATNNEAYCRFQLNMIKDRLLKMDSLPDYVMLPAGEKVTS